MSDTGSMQFFFLFRTSLGSLPVWKRIIVKAGGCKDYPLRAISQIQNCEIILKWGRDTHPSFMHTMPSGCWLDKALGFCLHFPSLGVCSHDSMLEGYFLHPRLKEETTRHITEAACWEENSSPFKTDHHPWGRCESNRIASPRLKNIWRFWDWSLWREGREV